MSKIIFILSRYFFFYLESTLFLLLLFSDSERSQACFTLMWRANPSGRATGEQPPAKKNINPAVTAERNSRAPPGRPLVRQRSVGGGVGGQKPSPSSPFISRARSRRRHAVDPSHAGAAFFNSAPGQTHHRRRRRRRTTRCRVATPSPFARRSRRWTAPHQRHVRRGCPIARVTRRSPDVRFDPQPRLLSRFDAGSGRDHWPTATAFPPKGPVCTDKWGRDVFRDTLRVSDGSGNDRKTRRKKRRENGPIP